MPVLIKEVEGEPWREEGLHVEVRVEEEEDGLEEVEEIELGWEEALEGDLEMAGEVFGELCEAVAMVELEKREEMEDDLLTGWMLPGAGSPDSCSSPFKESLVQNICRTFTEHSQNIRRTFAEHSQNIRRTFAEHSQNL